MRRNFIAVLCLSFMAQITWAQDGGDWRFYGYIKDMRSLYLFKPAENIKLNSLIHQRTNCRWFANENITLGASLRNQVFYGGFTSDFNQLLHENRALIDIANAIDPDNPVPYTYGELLNPVGGLLDFRVLWLDEPGASGVSEIDRFWIDWNEGKWQIRLGKQRVNWGINWVWNPNDLFNAFSFTDFDYEERAAADALRVQYYYDDFSQVELVAAAGRSFENNSFGLRWKTNKWNYDFQLILASFQDEPTIGFGWTGNLGNAGFKGELTHFFDEDRDKFEDQVVASFGFDYAFLNGFLIQAEALYNGYGERVPTEAGNALFFGNSNPKSLSPYTWSTFLGSSFAISPLLNASFGFILQPADGSFYLAPGLTYSLGSNIDLLVIGQLTQRQELSILPGADELFGEFYGVVNSRIKWSF